MRILMLTDFYPPFSGGVEHHVRNLSHALAVRGHEVAVATQRGPELPEYENDGRVRVYRIAGTLQRTSLLSHDPQRRWSPPFPDPEMCLALRRVVAQEHPEVVHAHSWLAHSFLPLKTMSRAKLVISLHNYGHDCLRTDLLYKGDALCSGPTMMKCAACAVDHLGTVRGLPSLFGFWAGSQALRAATDMFLPVSNAVANGNNLVHHGVPFEVIPNFIPDNLDDLGANCATLPSDLPAGGYLLFVGALRPLKGLDVLLEAYAGLSAPPPLVLLGGTFHDTPTQFPANVVVVRDWPHDAVMRAWRGSLLGITPSVWPEPCPTVVMEAMVSSRAVIASRIGGIPDLVADGVSGLLVPPGDTKALREALTRLLENPELRIRMGDAGRKRVAAFQASHVIPHFERIYSS